MLCNSRSRRFFRENSEPGETAFVSVNRLMEICFSTKNLPAPNHYDLPKSVFDMYKRTPCKCDPTTVEPPPFNQTAKVRFHMFAPIIVTIVIYSSSFKRFEESSQLDTPGPGAYEITTLQFCYGSILRAPFGAFGHRFKRITDVVTPGTRKERFA